MIVLNENLKKFCQRILYEHPREVILHRKGQDMLKFFRNQLNKETTTEINSNLINDVFQELLSER